jgi:hypothetical protein
MPRKTTWTCVVLLTVFASHAQTSALKTFHDAQYGVTFQYPARWSAGPDVLFYLGSEILELKPGGGAHEPLAKVGFVVGEGDKEYSATNLNGVQFVYNLIPQSTADACRKRVQDLSADPITQTTIHGVIYNHFSGGDAGLGHQASREIFSSFQNGHCYLFEEAIHTMTMDDAKQLDHARWKSLRRKLDSVIQSVHIARAG